VLSVVLRNVGTCSDNVLSSSNPIPAIRVVSYFLWSVRCKVHGIAGGGDLSLLAPCERPRERLLGAGPWAPVGMVKCIPGHYVLMWLLCDLLFLCATNN